MVNATTQQQDSGTGGDDIEIRVVTEDELADWGQAVAVGFMETRGDGHPEFHRAVFHPDRSLGAVHRGKWVGTFRSLPREITVPGGASVLTNAITNVTVSATHRRRGLLTRMMRQDLDAAVARGESLAILIAAEYLIYGRYGFGPSTARRGYTVDKLRARRVLHLPPAAEAGSLEFLSMEEWRKYGPDLHERFRRTQPGAIDRRDVNWQLRTGELKGPNSDWKEPLVVLHRDAAGEPDGLMAYQVTDDWTNTIAKGEMRISDYMALNRAAAAELWQFALGVDWMDRIRIDNIAPDDPLPLLFEDARACYDNGDTTESFMWLRVLDAPAAFAARSYACAGRVVLQVTDAMGYADGRWVLESADDGTGTCRPATDDEQPEIALDVSVLGTLYLSSERPSRLHAAGLLTELHPGAVTRLGALLHTESRPWCPDGF